MLTTSNYSAAISILLNNGIIAHQTDTVIGLACLPLDGLLKRLQLIKQRDLKKNFILLASEFQQLQAFVDISPADQLTLSNPTTLPTTWIVNAARGIPDPLVADDNTVAVRISQHPAVTSLCTVTGAIASTSANISSHPQCQRLEQVRLVFGPSIDYIDPHQALGTGISSTIIELRTGKILRN